MHDSLWFTTRSTLFQPDEAGWEEIARYEQPLRRLLARRYARALSQEDREDLLQEMLIEMRETLTGRFDRAQGRFRALLQTVVARRVFDRLRRAKASPLGPEAEQLTAPPSDELEALDLEAGLVEAVSACRDHFSGGPSKDLDVLHALTDRLVHGLSAREIAQRDGVSRDRVGRLLGKARDVIFQHLLADELGAPPDSQRLEACVTAFKQMLRKPGQARARLGELEPALAEALEAFWQRFQAALPRFEGDLTAAGRELAQGVELVLGAGHGESGGS